MLKNVLTQSCVILIAFVFLFFTNRVFANGGVSSKNLPAADNIIYVSPVPGARYVMTGTNIIVRASQDIDPVSLSNSGIFNVSGSSSGSHPGRLVLSGDPRTVIFKPDIPFTAGEKVTVKVNGNLKTVFGKTVSFAEFSFFTAKKDLNINAKPGIIREAELRAAGFASGLNYDSGPKPLQKTTEQDTPSDYPPLKVDTSDDPSSGYLFLASYAPGSSSQYATYLIVSDNEGNPVFSRKNKGLITDFKLQPSGVVTYFDEGRHKHYVMNTSMNIIDSVTCGNGYSNNAHELRMLPDGRIFLLCDDIETVDMSKIVEGGDTAAQVTGNVIQELDKDGNVIFQWRTWDHYKITDATHEDLTAKKIDYVHANAIEIDPDGSLLLSCRHMDEITKIDANTGDIIWRLGGKNNQFDFINDPVQFSHQHAIRRLPNGDITLYDDGNYHDPNFSRAVEYKLDTVNMTADLVWQYRSSPDIYGFAMGNVQRLSNGNTIIGWGASSTTVTEVTPDGKVALQMSFPQRVWSYRAFRFPFLFIQPPLAGKNLEAGKTVSLTWKSSGIDSIDIDYSIDNGKTWKHIVDDYDANNGSFSWIVPQIEADSCKIRIVNSDEKNYDDEFVSKSTFKITNQTNVKDNSLPAEYSLSDNYPNPFNPATTIAYSLPKESHVVITVYNAIGQLVKTLVNDDKPAGYYSINFNASGLSSGIYFYRLTAGSFTAVKKFVLMK